MLDIDGTRWRDRGKAAEDVSPVPAKNDPPPPPYEPRPAYVAVPEVRDAATLASFQSVTVSARDSLNLCPRRLQLQALHAQEYTGNPLAPFVQVPEESPGGCQPRDLP